jgi:hypothetical protein
MTARINSPRGELDCIARQLLVLHHNSADVMLTDGAETLDSAEDV